MRRRREDDLERELSGHLELEAEEQREAGRLPEEARYAAQRVLGNTLLIKEDVRPTWRWASLESVRRDLRYAFRVLRKSPGFTAATLISLTVGIGLNSSVFSVLNAILLRPLSSPEPERLVRVFHGDRGNLSYPNYQADPAVVGRAVRINGHPFEVIRRGAAGRAAAGGALRAPALGAGGDVRAGGSSRLSSPSCWRSRA